MPCSSWECSGQEQLSCPRGVAEESEQPCPGESQGCCVLLAQLGHGEPCPATLVSFLCWVHSLVWAALFSTQSLCCCGCWAWGFAGDVLSVGSAWDSLFLPDSAATVCSSPFPNFLLLKQAGPAVSCVMLNSHSRKTALSWPADAALPVCLALRPNCVDKPLGET